MAKKSKKIFHIIEITLVRILAFVFSVLPRDLSLFCGVLLGRIARYGGYRRNVVEKNFAHVAYWSPVETQRIIRKLYDTMGKYFVDFLRDPRKIPPHDPVDMALLHGLLEKKKGIISVQAHLGNWEVLARIFDTDQIPLSVIAKEMSNPYFERWLCERRAMAHISVIYHKNGLRKILRELKNNGFVAMLVDQNMRKEGTPVEFLGKPANTTRGAAGLLYRTGAAMQYAYGIIDKSNKYTIHFEEGVLPDREHLSEEEFIVAVQKEHNRAISEWIKKHPHHYFGWFHRRFKGYIQYS